jgi:hypothetical protein
MSVTSFLLCAGMACKSPAASIIADGGKPGDGGGGAVGSIPPPRASDAGVWRAFVGSGVVDLFTNVQSSFAWEGIPLIISASGGTIEYIVTAEEIRRILAGIAVFRFPERERVPGEWQKSARGQDRGDIGQYLFIPSENLANRWYAMDELVPGTFTGDVRWNNRGGGGPVRFRWGRGPIIRQVVVCGDANDATIRVEFSEEIRGGTPPVTVAASNVDAAQPMPRCEPLNPREVESRFETKCSGLDFAGGLVRVTVASPAGLQSLADGGVDVGAPLAYAAERTADGLAVLLAPARMPVEPREEGCRVFFTGRPESSGIPAVRDAASTQ